MNVEPKKIVTLDGAEVFLSANEVRLLIAELECVLRSAKAYEALPIGGFNSKYGSLILLKKMLEEKCTL